MLRGRRFWGRFGILIGVVKVVGGVRLLWDLTGCCWSGGGSRSKYGFIRDAVMRVR